MSVTERQKALRLVVKEIMVDEDTIKIKHSIPFTRSSTPGESEVGPKLPGYLLRSGSHQPAFG
jgi:site-specific DNA recombinase